METSFGRLVRFADADGKVWFGEAGSVTDPAELIGKSIEIYHGSAPWALASERSGEQREVKEVFTPLTPLHWPNLCAYGYSKYSDLSLTFFLDSRSTRDRSSILLHRPELQKTY